MTIFTSRKREEAVSAIWRRKKDLVVKEEADMVITLQVPHIKSINYVFGNWNPLFITHSILG